MFKTTSLFLFFISAISHADILANKMELSFCHKKATTVETVVVSNTGNENRKIEVSHYLTIYGGDSFTIKVGSCVPSGDVRCPVNLQPGQTVKILVTTQLTAGDASSHFEIMDVSNQQNEYSKKLFEIHLWASGWEGCGFDP